MTTTASIDNRQQRFLDMVDGNNGLIYKVCYMYAADSDHLKDLYQEVVANLWQGLDSFNAQSKISTWIYRVAINTCVSFQRRNNRHSGLQPIDDRVMALEDDSDLHRRQLRDMYEMIGRLGRLDKALIMLWLDEYSYDEIATLTGITRANVAAKLHRIKRRLANDND